MLPKISNKPSQGAEEGDPAGDTSPSAGGRRRVPNDCKGKKKKGKRAEGTVEIAPARHLLVVARPRRRSMTVTVVGASRSDRNETIEVRLERVTTVVRIVTGSWR